MNEDTTTEQNLTDGDQTQGGSGRREDTLEYWRSKHDGAQGYIRQLKKDLMDLQKQVDEAQDFSQQIAGRTIQELRSEREQLLATASSYEEAQQQLAALNEENAKLAASVQEIEAMRRESERVAIIQKSIVENPVLNTLYESNSLNTNGIDNESLPEYLAALGSQLTNAVEQVAQKTVSGSTPPRPNVAQGDPLDPDELYEQFNKSLPGTPERAAALEAWQYAIRKS